MSLRSPLQTKPASTAPRSFSPARSGLLQRKCACGDTPGPSGECDACRKKKLQRRSENLDLSSVSHPPSSILEVPPIVHKVLRSAGQPLDDATRAFMEPRFGHDFNQVPVHSSSRTNGPWTVVPSSDSSEREADAVARRVTASTPVAGGRTSKHDFSHVRLHTDSNAAKSARALNAKAYTVGDDIVFSDGQYSAETSAGRELIAHELTHVVQARANPSSESRNALHRKKFNTNEAACTATMTYLVQLLFKDEGADKWDTVSKTRSLARKTMFRKELKRSIEDTFNANPFRIKPDVPSFQSGLIFTEEKSCPCSGKGFEPKVQIDLVKDGEWSTAEDWEVDVAANPSGRGIISNNLSGYGDLDEADTTPVEKMGAPAGVTQVPAVHEFGHFIGLDHPGAGLGPSKSNTNPEYAHSGRDVKGRNVHGPTDLMGSGMQLRPFYFDPWRDQLNEKYGSRCAWKVIDPNPPAVVKVDEGLDKPARSLAPPVSTFVAPPAIREQ
jgi:hypothetical protein